MVTTRGGLTRGGLTRGATLCRSSHQQGIDVNPMAKKTKISKTKKRQKIRTLESVTKQNEKRSPQTEKEVAEENQEEVIKDMEEEAEVVKEVFEEIEEEFDEEVELEVDEEVAEENDDVEVPQEIEEEASQEVGEEHVSNQADTTSEPSMSTTKKKRTRGPTKMRKLAKDPMTKLDVYFNPTGQHSGPNSATLSSFLAVLVKEHVSVLLDDWRHLDDKTKDLMWEQVQGRFNLKYEWQKAAVLSQMNNAWRSFKSRLLSAVKAAESNAERLLLKPSNIQSIASWNNWIKRKTSTEFKIKSDKFRELKMSQIHHTTSRKGMFRLSQELKEKSSNPEKVTRSEVWLAGHTYKDGTPTRPELADTFEKIQSINSQMDSTSCDNIREDAVSQVLGKDKPGRVRGMGRGVTMTKLAFLQARDSKVEKLEATQAEMMSKLNDVVRLLAGKNCPDLASQSGVSDVSKGGIKCQLLDWYAVDDVVVGEAEVCSAEPSYKIGRIPLGPDALAVIVKSVLKPEAYLWRPTKTHSSIGEALGEQIPWPEDRVIFKDTNKTAGSSGTNGNESIRRYTIFDWKKVDCVIAEGVMLSTDPMEMVNGIPLGPNAVILSVDFVIKPDAYLWRPSEDKSTIGEAVNTNIAWPLHKIELLNPPTPAESVTKIAATASISTNNSNGNPKKKCIMFDSNNSGRIVAEGQVLSSNPADSIHCAPLGPNASKVMVQVPIIGDAGVWRPTSEFQFISDAVGTIVAWPNDKLKFV